MNIEVRDLRNGDWYWIHKAVLINYAKKIGSTSLAVYNVLASYTNQENKSWPSQQTIGNILGVTRATISKSIKILEKHGIISIERTRYSLIYSLLKVNYIEELKENSRCKAQETCKATETRCIPQETQMYSVGNSDVKLRNTINKKNNKKNNKNIREEEKINIREEKVEDKSSTPPFSKTLEEIPQKHLDLCKLLKTLMLQNNPKALIPKSFTEWANSVRLMIKIDNHTLEEIKRLIIWSQQHNFWKNNIESMPKLRAKFGRLWGEMISSSYQQKEREEIEYKPL